MAIIESIKQKILQMAGGEFQNLCNSYLCKKGYGNIVALGSHAGTTKTTPGTPDAYFYTADKKYVFVEYTTQTEQVFQKIKDDIEKCLDISKTGISHEKIAEIIYCHTSANITPAQDTELRALCSNVGVNLVLTGIDSLSEELYLCHPNLVKDVLGIALDTGQIQSHDDFIEDYNKNKMSAPLDTEFLLRDKELDEIETAAQRTNVVILSGAAGAGKTRLALYYAQNYATEHDMKLLCVRNKAQLIYEDLQRSIDAPGNYFLIIDDANQLSELQHVIKYTTMQPDGYNVKILITVRDYAIEKVKGQICEIASFEIIRINKFTDEEIKDLVKTTLDISNSEYLDQIVRIAEGNARLAMLAGKIAYASQKLSSIHDASELYDNYYGAYLQGEHLLAENKMLISASIIAFLEVVHLDHLDGLFPIFSSCDMGRNDFVESVRILHEKEIVDICNDKVVKFSEQCLSNYLLKYVFFDKKILSFSLMIKNFFVSHKGRTIHAVNTLLAVFRKEELFQFVQEEVTKLWDELAKENVPWFFNFVKVFFRINPTASLLILRDKIQAEETVVMDVSDIDTQEGKNNESVTNDIIEILSGFADTEDLQTALDIFFQYYLKRPDLYMQFYHAANRGFGVKKDSGDYGFYTQIMFLEKIKEYSADWSQGFIIVFFLEIAKEFLSLYFTPAEAGRNRTITMYQIPLALSEGVEKYRGFIWDVLGNICATGSYTGRVRKILETYRGPTEPVSISVLEFDLPYIKALVESYFLASELQNVLLANRLRKMFAQNDFACETLFSEYFESEDFHIYCILKGPAYRDVPEGQNHREFKEQAINDFVSSADLTMIQNAIDVFVEIMSFDDHKKWEISEGLRMTMDALIHLRKKDYVAALKYYLEKEPPEGLYPVYCVKTLFSFLADTEVFELIKSHEGSRKNLWIYAYYHELPQEFITTSHLEGLYGFLADTSDKSIASSGYRDVDFLEKYSTVDKEVLFKGCEIILAKAAYSPFMVGIYFGLLFNSYHNTPQEVVRKFQDGHLELLVKIYFFMEECRNHDDHDGQFLKEIYLAFPPILDRYIECLARKSTGAFSDYAEKHQCFFEVDNFIEIYDEIFERLLQEYPDRCWSVSYYLEAVLSSRENAPELLRSRQDEWIRHCIQKYYTDEMKMCCLFAFIANLSGERKQEYLGLFLKYNSSIETFKQLPLMSYAATGSSIPIYLRQIDYLNSLLPLFRGLAWLEHKQYIEGKVSNLRERIKETEINELLRGW